MIAGRVWRGRRRRRLGILAGSVRGVGRVGSPKKRGSDVAQIVKIAFGERSGLLAGLRQKNELAEVAEGGGAASGDAIAGESLKDALEGTMNVETAIGTGEELV